MKEKKASRNSETTKEEAHQDGGSSKDLPPLQNPQVVDLRGDVRMGTEAGQAEVLI